MHRSVSHGYSRLTIAIFALGAFIWLPTERGSWAQLGSDSSLKPPARPISKELSDWNFRPDPKRPKGKWTIRNVTGSRPVEEKIEAALRQPITFSVSTLDELAKRIAESFKIPVQLDEKSLSPIGITPETELEASVVNIKLSQAMRRMNRNLGDGSTELAYYVSDDTLWISTAERATENLQTKLYDVRCLGFREPDMLIDLIESQTSGKWKDNGGSDTDGTIAPWVGGIMVRQTRKVHEEIEGLLDFVTDYFAALDAPAP